MTSDCEYERVRRRVEGIDPALVAAVDDIDLGVLAWALSLSPFERLQAASGTLRFLSAFRRVSTDDR
jgi:hypothetical protein